MSTIRDILKQIIREEFIENYGVPCTVIPGTVNLVTNTCDCQPINGDAKFLDVRIQAGDGKGVVIIPADNSVVLVQPINAHSGYIALFSNVQSIKLLDGTFGGLIKIQDLVTKVNNLESKVNTINGALKTHTHAGVTTGAGTSGTSPAFSAITDLTPTQRAELENDKITHGTV